ncbi:MAG: DMT family transporter [Lachnospira sp.]
MKNVKGSLILFVAALIWGTTFVAQVSGSNHIGVFTYNASRCFVGCLFLWVVSSAKDKRNGKKEKWPVKGGIACGIILFLAMSAQQAGISLYPENVAAAGRSGFLTAIYVVIVAVIVSIVGRKLHILVLLSVMGTVSGMYLLCLKDGMSGIYTGDIFGLACAFCFAGHILVVDKYRNTDSIKLSCLQFLVAGIMSLIMCVTTEKIVIADVISSAVPILYAGVLSSGVAYTLQMVGQKYAEPAVASIVMSLESVIAAIAGAVLLGEVLAGREIVGCLVVFLSVIIAQIPGMWQAKNE